MDDLTTIELDIKLANVYLSLMDADIDMSDADREMFYMCLRMAFLEGQQDVMERIKPLIADYEASMARHGRAA